LLVAAAGEDGQTKEVEQVLVVQAVVVLDQQETQTQLQGWQILVVEVEHQDIQVLEQETEELVVVD
jgi:hypothetical protein